MKSIILLCTVLIFSTAEAGKLARLVEKQPAPFAGILLDRDAENQVNIAFETASQAKAILEDQTDMIQNLHKQNKNYEEQTAILNAELERSQSGWIKALYFLGGAFVGGLVYNKLDGK